MKLDIGSDLPEFRKFIATKKKLAPIVVKKATFDATLVIFTLSRDALADLVYNESNNPIPTVNRSRRKIRSGKRAGKFRTFKAPKPVPAWRRTSHLLRSERFFFRGSGINFRGYIDNKAAYAKPRHDLNRPSPIDGKTRAAPWRDVARSQGAPLAREIFREAIRTFKEPEVVSITMGPA